MSTVINAETPQSTREASACHNIHDLTGTHTSDPATWPDYGVKSLVRSPQCSLKPSMPLKGSCVRWRVWKMTLSGLWIAMPTEGFALMDSIWSRLMERMNAEATRRVRSKNVGG